MESPILIDVWTVDPSRRDELLRRISDSMHKLGEQSGFVSGQVYESVDGGVVMVSVRMRTVEERQRLTDSPEIRELLRELRAIAHSHARLYRLAETVGEDGEQG
jgi:heme-degrading monooxygenase HmoA